jgi:hypothetical protein
MVKKAPAAKKVADEGPKQSDSTKQLVDAIITVKSLQAFIAEHGTLEKALAAVACMQNLIQMTGGFDQLRQALEIVVQQDQPAAPSPSAEGAEA